MVKRYKLWFPKTLSRKPIMFRLGSEFNIKYNIIEGFFSKDKDSWAILEVSGAKKEIEKMLSFLIENKVRLEEVK